MLNSLLSHLLFGSSSSSSSATNDNNIQVDNNSCNEQLNIQQQQQQQELKQSAIKNKNENDKYIDVRNDVDWVIIDPTDNDEVKKHLKRKLNSMVKSMQMSEYGLTNLFDNNEDAVNRYANCGASDGATLSDESMDRDVSFDEQVQSRPISPSLFDNDKQNNEETMQHQEQEIEQPEHQLVYEQPQPEPQPQPKVVEQDSWLITPLPSLVSLQTSQKSMIENAPLENLLIEHPSMSVFISSSSSSDEFCEEQLEDSSFALINNIKDEKIKMKKKKKSAKKQSSVQLQQQQQQVNNNKENNQSRTPVASSSSSSSSTRIQILNQQTKPTSNKLVHNTHFQKERCNYTRLQEKCKNYVKNVNLKQRKYHNLQQPQYLNVNFVNIRH